MCRFRPRRALAQIDRKNSGTDSTVLVPNLRVRPPDRRDNLNAAKAAKNRVQMAIYVKPTVHGGWLLRAAKSARRWTGKNTFWSTTGLSRLLAYAEAASVVRSSYRNDGQHDSRNCFLDWLPLCAANHQPANSQLEHHEYEGRWHSVKYSSRKRHGNSRPDCSTPDQIVSRFAQWDFGNDAKGVWRCQLSGTCQRREGFSNYAAHCPRARSGYTE